LEKVKIIQKKKRKRTVEGESRKWEKPSPRKKSLVTIKPRRKKYLSANKRNSAAREKTKKQGKKKRKEETPTNTG